MQVGILQAVSPSLSFVIVCPSTVLDVCLSINCPGCLFVCPSNVLGVYLSVSMPFSYQRTLKIFLKPYKSYPINFISFFVTGTFTLDCDENYCGLMMKVFKVPEKLFQFPNSFRTAQRRAEGAVWGVQPPTPIYPIDLKFDQIFAANYLTVLVY